MTLLADILQTALVVIATFGIIAIMAGLVALGIWALTVTEIQLNRKGGRK